MVPDSGSEVGPGHHKRSLKDSKVLKSQVFLLRLTSTVDKIEDTNRYRSIKMVVETTTHRLPDGRTLAYCEFGDPNGDPVFHAHGVPSSRLEGALLHDSALKYGFRVLSTDRPVLAGRLTFPTAGSSITQRTFHLWPMLSASSGLV